MSDHVIAATPREPKHVWLVGAGSMSLEYAKVLTHLHVPFSVIGRGEESARAFEASACVSVHRGGLASALKSNAVPKASHAIVAIDVDELVGASGALLEAGVKNILVEKPGGMDSRELRTLSQSAAAHGADVRVAYNRRYYASLLAAERMIREDGGVTSFHCEFTEWSHQIAELPTPAHIKGIWLLGNSSHVLDMAFHVAGTPEELNCFRSGSLDWHPAGAIYTGAGRTVSGALFSYYANWDGPGRWSFEVSTKHRRMVFKPLEQLSVQKRGSVAVEPFDLSEDGEKDKLFKPGLYRMTEDFLTMGSKKLCRLDEQAELARIYERIAGYGN